MKPAAILENKTIKELYVLARKANIAGWHDMNKSTLIKAIQKKIPSVPFLANAVQKELNALEKKNGVCRKKVTSTKTLKEKKTTQLKKPLKKTVVSKTILASSLAKNIESGKSKKVALNEQPLRTGERKKAAPRKKVSQPKQSTPVKSPTKKVVETVTRSVRSDKSETKKTQTAAKTKSRPNPKQEQERVPFQGTATPPEFLNDRGNTTAPENPTPSVGTAVQKKIMDLKEKLLLHKTLGAIPSGSKREARDQLILMVRDPFWLHAYWEISSPLVDRIRAAMGHLWHTADPVLRLYRVHSDASGAIRQEYLTDIHIHGGINNWYIDVDDPPSQFLIEIGYLARDGQFFILLSSNIVETPQRYVHDSFGHPDVSWMGVPPDVCAGYFSETSQSSPILSDNEIHNGNSGNGAPNGVPLVPLFPTDKDQCFEFDVDAEIVIKGKTSQNVQLTIKGETIRLKEDGSFSIRYHLPERRHVFPVVAVSPDGIETKTVILAIERNTKILETVIKDEEEE